ncbi:MAG: GNAT family N-acetyltransferase [Proteobacteria bacterium]|jgi:N-acetylglutamate synthase-like GNAT family acetyltransferase|nr:GNAT family N-acetyltransferase [Pseudomonadota bacterium]
MKDDIVIKKVPGSDLREKIDLFYSTNGSRAKARDTDVYLLALHGLEIVGAVRFCIEEETYMLRTMMIDSKCRRNGIGSKLLSSFAKHLELNNIKNAYCLPYPHLESFYSQIGFNKIDIENAPRFLQERYSQYLGRETKTICMKRN